MTDAVTLPIDADELRLAQLACTKLAMLLQGAVSVGLPTVEAGWPQARDFLEDRFRVLGAFAGVLEAVTAKPDRVNDTLRLREKAKDASAALEELRRHLLAHLDAADRSPDTLPRARASAEALCDAIAKYASLVQLDRAQVAKVKTVVLEVFDALDGA